MIIRPAKGMVLGRIRTLLADYGWHSDEEIVEALGLKYIPRPDTEKALDVGAAAGEFTTWTPGTGYKGASQLLYRLLRPEERK